MKLIYSCEYQVLLDESTFATHLVMVMKTLEDEFEGFTEGESMEDEKKCRAIGCQQPLRCLII